MTHTLRYNFLIADAEAIVVAYLHKMSFTATNNTNTNGRIEKKALVLDILGMLFKSFWSNDYLFEWDFISLIRTDGF